MFEYKNNVWLFVGVLLACFMVSMYVRYQQFETWKLAPQKYFLGERPMMTTLDAPYWLRWAREYNEGVYLQKNGLRGYPDSTKIFSEQEIPAEFRDVGFDADKDKHLGIATTNMPLLSLLIAHFAPLFEFNYYLAGTLLIPVLASLFILPMGVYFFRIGIPVSGLLGGLIGTFASGYYMRSSIGRIDTDMLNLFFPVLTGLLILLAGKAKTGKNVLLYVLGAGLSMFLFHWWFGKAGFTLAYFIVLVVIMFVYQIQFRLILISAFLFILCANPVTFTKGTDAVSDFLKGYFYIEDARLILTDNETTPATFPNTMSTISEVDRVPMDEVFRRVLSNITLDWIGFLAFFGLALFNWRILLPLSPILVLGMMSFYSSNRFIMFLGPFIGIGLGWLLHFGVEGVFLIIKKTIENRDLEDIGLKEKRIKNKVSLLTSIYNLATCKYFESTPKDSEKKLKDEYNKVESQRLKFKSRFWKGLVFNWLGWSRQGVQYLAMACFFWLISGQTAISFVPYPSIHTGIYATFLELKKRVPDNSALLTWWDYGYAITDATGLATFHDGSTQNSPKTYFIARGLISDDPEELYKITKYLASKGNYGIAENNSSPEALLETVLNPQQKPFDPIYLFFTADMTGKYGAISKLGSWDLVKGGSNPRGYQNLACNKITNEEMNCRGARIDLKTGKINNHVPLKRMVFIQEGKILREVKFNNRLGHTLQLLVTGKRIVEVQLIDEVVFMSNYNQMFLLGRFREDIFEETYNAFPFSRLFRFKY